MCGISFLYDRTGKLGAAAAARMRAATAHRGPDSCGAVQFGDGGPGTVYLEHSRLKIVGLSDDANQPLVSGDGRYTLIFNGEIYNWAALRRDLEAQHVGFRTQSDAEVLLQLLIAEGPKAGAKLRGMFAFVFYDSVAKSVIVGRDAAGLKPLFMTETAEGIAISSEIGGVRSSGLAVGEWSAAQLPAYLTSRFAASPATFWSGIVQPLPGVLTLRYLDERESRTTMVTTEAQAAPLMTERAPIADVSAIRKLLTTSLTRHLTADVPVGLWLSGGVDSTLLLALAQEQAQKLPCFSIALRSEEGSFGSDDRRYARTAAKLYDAEYHEFEVGSDLLLHTDEALASLSQPIADSSVLLTWWLAQQTSRAVKAVLSGAGADEWFAGYNRHQAFNWYLRGRWALPLVRPLLTGLSRTLPGATDNRWRKSIRLAQRFLAHAHPAVDQTLASFVRLAPELSDTLLRPQPWKSEDERSSEVTPNPSQRHAQTSLDQLLAYDRFRYLPNDILALTDHTSMRHGLEVRTPYLDEDLTAYVARLPARLLLRHGPKWILRELLNQRGGQAFTQRRKEGFGLPLTRWLNMSAYQWLFDPVRRRSHPLFEHFDFDRTQAFLNRFRTGNQDLGAEAWALITLFRWYDLQTPTA